GGREHVDGRQDGPPAANRAVQPSGCAGNFYPLRRYASGPSGGATARGRRDGGPKAPLRGSLLRESPPKAGATLIPNQPAKKLTGSWSCGERHHIYSTCR